MKSTSLWAMFVCAFVADFLVMIVMLGVFSVVFGVVRVKPYTLARVCADIVVGVSLVAVHVVASAVTVGIHFAAMAGSITAVEGTISLFRLHTPALVGTGLTRTPLTEWFMSNDTIAIQQEFNAWVVPSLAKVGSEDSESTYMGVTPVLRLALVVLGLVTVLLPSCLCAGLFMWWLLYKWVRSAWIMVNRVWTTPGSLVLWALVGWMHHHIYLWLVAFFGDWSGTLVHSLALVLAAASGSACCTVIRYCFSGCGRFSLGVPRPVHKLFAMVLVLVHCMQPVYGAPPTHPARGLAAAFGSAAMVGSVLNGGLIDALSAPTATAELYTGDPTPQTTRFMVKDSNGHLLDTGFTLPETTSFATMVGALMDKGRLGQVLTHMKATQKRGRGRPQQLNKQVHQLNRHARIIEREAAEIARVDRGRLCILTFSKDNPQATPLHGTSATDDSNGAGAVETGTDTLPTIYIRIMDTDPSGQRAIGASDKIKTAVMNTYGLSSSSAVCHIAAMPKQHFPIKHYKPRGAAVSCGGGDVDGGGGGSGTSSGMSVASGGGGGDVDGGGGGGSGTSSGMGVASGDGGAAASAAPTSAAKRKKRNRGPNVNWNGRDGKNAWNRLAKACKKAEANGVSVVIIGSGRTSGSMVDPAKIQASSSCGTTGTGRTHPPTAAPAAPEAQVVPVAPAGTSSASREASATKGLQRVFYSALESSCTDDLSAVCSAAVNKMLRSKAPARGSSESSPRLNSFTPTGSMLKRLYDASKQDRLSWGDALAIIGTLPDRVVRALVGCHNKHNAEETATALLKAMHAHVPSKRVPVKRPVCNLSARYCVGQGTQSDGDCFELQDHSLDFPTSEFEHKLSEPTLAMWNSFQMAFRLHGHSLVQHTGNVSIYAVRTYNKDLVLASDWDAPALLEVNHTSKQATCDCSHKTDIHLTRDFVPGREFIDGEAHALCWHERFAQVIGFERPQEAKTAPCVELPGKAFRFFCHGATHGRFVTISRNLGLRCTNDVHNTKKCAVEVDGEVIRGFCTHKQHLLRHLRDGANSELLQRVNVHMSTFTSGSDDALSEDKHGRITYNSFSWRHDPREVEHCLSDPGLRDAVKARDRLWRNDIDAPDASSAEAEKFFKEFGWGEQLITGGNSALKQHVSAIIAAGLCAQIGRAWRLGAALPFCALQRRRYASYCVVPPEPENRSQCQCTDCDVCGYDDDSTALEDEVTNGGSVPVILPDRVVHVYPKIRKCRNKNKKCDMYWTGAEERIHRHSTKTAIAHEVSVVCVCECVCVCVCVAPVVMMVPAVCRWWWQRRGTRHVNQHHVQGSVRGHGLPVCRAVGGDGRAGIGR